MSGHGNDGRVSSGISNSLGLLVDALTLADDVGEDERNDDGDGHAEEIRKHGLGLHGKDAGQATDADGVGRAGEQAAEEAGDGGAGHGAQEREDVLQVDAEDGGLGDAEVAGDAGRDVDLLGVLVALLEDDHGEDGRALRDVGKGDHRPEHRSAVVGDELQVDGVGHVVQTGDDQRSVDAAEDGAEEHAEVAGDACVNDGGDAGAESPADGAEDEVGSHDAQQDGAERDDDHLDDGRRYLLEEALKIVEGDGCEDGRNNLCLIANHVDLREAEVPAVLLPRLSGCASNAVRVE